MTKAATLCCRVKVRSVKAASNTTNTRLRELRVEWHTDILGNKD